MCYKIKYYQFYYYYCVQAQAQECVLEERLMTYGKEGLVVNSGLAREAALVSTPLVSLTYPSIKLIVNSLSWLSNIKEWTQMDVHSLLSSAQDRQLWRSLCKSIGTPTA